MHLFIIPLLIMVVTQAVKLALEAYQGTFSWSHINNYGGMPSSHAALASSLAYTVGYFEGFDSSAFAIALILFIVIIRDATGYRFQLGIHGRILNQLIKDLPDRQEYKYPILSDRLGHKPTEVLVGVIIGLVGTAALIALTM